MATALGALHKWECSEATGHQLQADNATICIGCIALRPLDHTFGFGINEKYFPKKLWPIGKTFVNLHRILGIHVP